MEHIKRITILIAIMVMRSVSAELVSTNCCPIGQVLYRLGSPEGCWETHTNKSTPMTLTCSNTERLHNSYSIDTAGNIELFMGNEEATHVENGRFCLANVSKMGDVNLTRIWPVVVVCFDDIEESPILAYCLIVSTVFLSITTLIYTALPKLRDLQGKSLINFCGSLAIALAILSIMNLMEYTNMDFCAARGFFLYFFLMASFFWTNAISIQVLRSTRRPCSIVDYGWKEFGWYAIYAWGCSAVLTICMAIVNYHPGKHQRPGIGLNHCWFTDKTQFWYYLYSVMTILLVTNLCIFIYTSTIIWRRSFLSSHTRALKYKLVMSVRLIILMGLPWIFEMITSSLDRNFIWIIIDVINALQGLLIFLILVVFRRRALRAMYQKGWLKCVSGLVEKWLAIDDDEEQVVGHTDVAMSERNGI